MILSYQMSQDEDPQTRWAISYIKLQIESRRTEDRSETWQVFRIFRLENTLILCNAKLETMNAFKTQLEDQGS